MMARVSETLGHSLTLDQFNQVKFRFTYFPSPGTEGIFDRPSNPMLYPDFSDQDDRRKYQFAVKRLIDVLGSGIGLVSKRADFPGSGRAG